MEGTTLGSFLLYAAALAVTAWGTAHIVKTGAVVSGFEPLSRDNRLVLTMEWVLEGITLCFIGVLVAVVTLRSDSGDPVALLVYRGSAVMLLVMAGTSLFTGARAKPLPYKLCPVIFSSAALLLILGSIV